MKKHIMQIVVASCLAVLLPKLGVFIAVSNLENESFYIAVRAITSITGLLLAVFTLIPAVKLARLLKIRDTLFSALAGFVLILLWYGQYALEFSQKFSTSLLLFGYPFITAIVLILLLKRKYLIITLAKISMFLVSALFFYYLSGYFDLHYILLNHFIPGYGRMSAGGGFALMISSFYYYIINTSAVLLSLCFCKRKKTD
ncbi:MAG: hypothetical protein FWG61_08520 [Firmicutes bacterium]|nr:hypothetical protein [Bacillota bacterium]